jgi:hypothetical protein
MSINSTTDTMTFLLSVKYLQPITTGEKLILPATTGDKTIASARNIFDGRMDLHFKNLDGPSTATPETQIEIYKLVRGGKMKDILSHFPLRFTQSQVVAFMEHYPHLLHPNGWATFLPFTVNGEDFFATVYRSPSGVFARLRHISDNFAWSLDHHIVLPVVQS